MSATHEQAVLKAAVVYGSHGDGVWASVDGQRDFWPAPNRRRRCGCGCGGAATHVGGSNAVALMAGCELSVRRWVRDGKDAA